MDEGPSRLCSLVSGGLGEGQSLRTAAALRRLRMDEVRLGRVKAEGGWLGVQRCVDFSQRALEFLPRLFEAFKAVCASPSVLQLFNLKQGYFEGNSVDVVNGMWI